MYCVKKNQLDARSTKHEVYVLVKWSHNSVTVFFQSSKFGIILNCGNYLKQIIYSSPINFLKELLIVYFFWLHGLSVELRFVM